MVHSSLRDDMVSYGNPPWVETHGYHRWSLCDQNTGGCSAAKVKLVVTKEETERAIGGEFCDASLNPASL